MSEAYEAVIVRADGGALREAFALLTSPLHWRLVQLAGSVFGIYRVARKTDHFDSSRASDVARSFCNRFGAALAVFYDNGCGIRTALLFTTTGEREFGEHDELWVPLDEHGEPMREATPLHANDLKAEQEYECILSAIGAGLNHLGVPPTVFPDLLKQAFCYDQLGCEAEHDPGAGSR